jgi:hypothetical protein
MMSLPCLTLGRDAARSAAAGSVLIHEWAHGQHACGQADCQAARRQRTQAKWCSRNPDYFAAGRMQARSTRSQPPEPLRLPRPLNRLPWGLAQDQFGVQGADFLGVMGTVLLAAAQDQFKAYPIDCNGFAGTLPPFPGQDQSGPGPD